MSYVYGENFNKKVSGIKFKEFIGARFARIYPLYLFTLCWGAIAAVIIHQLATGLDPGPAALFNLKGIPACLLLIQGLHLYIAAPFNWRCLVIKHRMVGLFYVSIFGTSSYYLQTLLKNRNSHCTSWGLLTSNVLYWSHCYSCVQWHFETGYNS